MAVLQNLGASAQADYITDQQILGGDSAVVPGVAFKSSVTEGTPMGFSRTVLSSPTVALVQFALGSTASAPILEIKGQGFVSCTTILFTTGGTAGTGAIRVKYDGGNYGWIPVLPAGAVTAAPRG